LEFGLLHNQRHPNRLFQSTERSKMHQIPKVSAKPEV
jgi:hypothetical protein